MRQILVFCFERCQAESAPQSDYLVDIHSIKMVGSHRPSFLRFTTCSWALWFTLWEAGRGGEIFIEGGGYSPLFLWNVIPSHCWPLLTPPPRDPPLPRCYANLCCALNRCPNNSLSGGGGGKPGLWQEKNAAIFMAGPDYHTAEDLYLGGGRGSGTRFQRFRFPGLLKRSDEKGWEGVEGGVSARVKSLRLCCAEAGELCLRGPLPTQEVLCKCRHSMFYLTVAVGQHHCHNTALCNKYIKLSSSDNHKKTIVTGQNEIQKIQRHSEIAQWQKTQSQTTK